MHHDLPGGASGQVGSPANRSTSDAMSRMTSIFFPRLSNGLQTCRPGVGFRDRRHQTEMRDLRLEILRGLGTKGR
jgi:hypothetical protein